MVPHALSVLVLASGLVLAGGACKREPAENRAPPPVAAAPRDATPPADAIVTGPPHPDTWFRVEAVIDDLGRVPFLLGLESDTGRAFLKNGEEHLEVIVLRTEPLLVRIPVLGTTVSLEDDGAGSLRGVWDLTYYARRTFPVVARRASAPTAAELFPGTAPPVADASGTWRVDIQEFGVGRANLRQAADGTLAGSFIPPEIGDMRYLTGRVTGDRLKMSVFDGMHGFLVEATLSPDGQRLEGRWLIAAIGAFTFTGTRANVPTLDELVSARMKPGATRITLPELERRPYKGNPVIVDFAGTWCPVCIDLTPHLVALQKRHADAGLQILSYSLEPEADAAEQVAAQTRLQEFKTRYGVTWPIDMRFTDDYLAHLPKEIEKVSGFPVTIWVHRDGTVEAVHTGFASASVPDEHAATLAKFERWTEAITAPGAGSATKP